MTFRAATFGDICEFNYGKSLASDNRIPGDVVVYGSNGPVGTHNAPLSSGPTIVIGRKGSVGEVHYCDGPNWAIDTTYFVDANSTDCNLKWLAYALGSSRIRQLNRAAAVPGLNRNDAYRESILVPPLDEQKRIAAILDKADQLRQKRRQAIALLDSLTQSIFLEMFGDLVENDSAFPQGHISDWVEDFETGKNLAPDPDNSDPLSYRVLKVSAVTSGMFKPDEAKALPKGYKAPPNHLIRRGDLLFSRANTAELVGATAMVDADYERIVLPDKIWRFVWNAKNKPNPFFIQGLFSSLSFRGEISKRATGTSGSMKNISKEKVLNISVGAPARQLQDDFSQRVEATQRCRLLYKNQLSILEAQFSSLQHRAFSGQL